MSRLNEREIARRLAAQDDVEPPAELLARLRAEIPEDPGARLRLVATAAREDVRPRAFGGRRLWLLAASIAVALLGGFLALEVRRQAAAPGELELSERPAAAPEAGAGVAERMPRPPAAASRRPEPEMAPSAASREAAGVESDGRRFDLGARNEAGAPPPPMAAAQPVEVPELLAAEDEVTTTAESQLQERRREAAKQRAAVAPKPQGVVGGVVGGVAGGVPGGTPGGMIAGVPSSPKTMAADAPLRLGRLGESKEMEPSTGGTAEPNDEPYGDVFFRTYGVNPFIDTEDDRLSTFGLDVDTASYTVVRRYLADGHLPPPEAVRVEEMVNFFAYGDAPPRSGDFAIHVEGAPSPFAGGERYRLLRFNLRAREVSAADRKPAILTFVVDVSGSMDYENRLELVKRALGLLLGELRAEDRVGLVVYGSEGRVLLEHTSDKAAIGRAVDRLVAEGSTNAEEGLVLGYELADRAFRRGALNRVILCSDGVANVGATGPQSILARIGQAADRGIELTTVGFGMGNYNDVLMEQLADKGDGRYAYVDTLDEARRVFVEDLTGTLQTVASEARVQVEFNPAVVARYRLLGYENRDIADHRFRDDTVDAGEIGAGHGVTALYEIKLQPEAPAGLPGAVLRLRWKSARTQQFTEEEQVLRAADMARTWESAPRGLRLAAIVGEFAEILRHSYWAKDGDLDALARRAQRVADAFPGDQRVSELVSLIGKAAALAPRGDDAPRPEED